VYVQSPVEEKNKYADKGTVYANKYFKSFTCQIYK